MGQEEDVIRDGLFKTTDLDLIAAIMLEGHVVVDAVPSTLNRYHVVFAFNASEELKDFVKRYRLRQVRVEPISYYDEIRRVRMQINQIIELNK